MAEASIRSILKPGWVDVLERFRIIACLTKRELCDKADISYPTLRKIYCGDPTMRSLQSVSGALGVDVSIFMLSIEQISEKAAVTAGE